MANGVKAPAGGDGGLAEMAKAGGAGAGENKPEIAMRWRSIRKRNGNIKMAKTKWRQCAAAKSGWLAKAAIINEYREIEMP